MLRHAAWVVAACLLCFEAPAAEPVFQVERNVMIPMRDGVELAANVMRPPGAGPFPVVLARSPYGKLDDRWPDARQFLESGCAVVVQDCRGRGDSQGDWEPFLDDGRDGYDTLEWIGRQPWCNARVAMIGGSYLGWTQWAAAPTGSRYLKAMMPVVPFADVYHDIAYPGGAFQLSLLFGWGAVVGGSTANLEELAERFAYLPLVDWADQFEKQPSFLRQWIEHPCYDDYWRARGIDRQYDDVTVPTLNVGGWYDVFSVATLDTVNQVRDRSRDRLARRQQFVVMGPWGHGVGVRKLGQLDFGERAELNVFDLQRQWVDYWLRDEETGVEDWPAVRLFVMGENRWRDEHEWPLARTRFTAWHLRSEGRLSLEPAGDELCDRFTYNPADPVPTRGGNNLLGAPIGPFDQSEVERRGDVLVYTSAPLDNALEVTGPVKLVLFASSSAPDTDFTGKLVDVHPDGRAFNLCDGILRARYRESRTEPTLLEPDRVYRYEIDLGVTSNVFLRGHSIRLEVSSSNFPRFDRNPNTGHDFGRDAELRTAEQRVFHSEVNGSHLLLPIIPRE